MDSTTETRSSSNGISINQEAVTAEQYDSYKQMFSELVDGTWRENAAKICSQ
jgi:hypothetical protein